MVNKIKTEKPSTAKGVVSAAAAVAAAAMVVRSFVPMEIQRFIFKQARQFLATFLSNDFVIVIEEFEGLSKNELFKAAETYAATLVGSSTRRCRATLPAKENKISVTMEAEEELADEFRGMKLKWRLVCEKNPAKYSNPGRFGYTLSSKSQFYELSFHRKCRARVLEEYLPYIVEKSKAAAIERKSLKLYSYDRAHRDETGLPNSWKAVILDHPATFDTLAMDPDQKQMLINDIDQFLARKEVYRRIGRAWKRGYLLFGPPGTGKSSLIAAMANYLKFDVYDLELTAIKNNTELQRLMTSTSNQSILVVEDIDCSIDLTEKRQAKKMVVNPYYDLSEEKQTITLSGLLNFIDGLRSSCGDERIIIFTTNHIEKLDPALLRPGRMDVHIHMSYCTPSGFRLLASNYLEITDHPLFADVEKELETAKVTPAEVGEQLLRYGEPAVAIKGLIQFLEEKKKMKHQQVSEQVSTNLLEAVSEPEQVSINLLEAVSEQTVKDNILVLS